MHFSTLRFCSRKFWIEIYLMYFLLVNKSAMVGIGSTVGIRSRRNNAFAIFHIHHIITGASATPLICGWVRKRVHTVTVTIILCTNRIAIVTCVLIGTIRSSFAWFWNYLSIFIGWALATKRINSLLACGHGFIYTFFLCNPFFEFGTMNFVPQPFVDMKPFPCQSIE